MERQKKIKEEKEKERLKFEEEYKKKMEAAERKIRSQATKQEPVITTVQQNKEVEKKEPVKVTVQQKIFSDEPLIHSDDEDFDFSH
jgi:hypothetical protein